MGDIVWLATKNIKIKRLLKKLDHEIIGPYKVKELVGSLYRLDLPTSIKIYNIFHPSLFQLAANDTLPDKYNDFLPPIVVNDNKEQKLNMTLTFVNNYQSGKKNDKADALMRKPKDQATDKENKQLEHPRYVLLPPKYFELLVKLQLIKGDGNKNLPKVPCL